MAIGTSLEQRTGTLYRNVTFESTAEYDGNDKKLYTFDQSLARLRQAGQVRHPRPSEVFSLLIANLENKLTPQQKLVAKDMLNSYSEWMSAAVERNGDTLTVYTDPEGLVWDATSGLYVKQGFKSTDKKEFSIHGILSKQHVDLDKFDPDLVKFLYSCPFDKLPSVMQRGRERTQVYLPPEGQIGPAGRGGFYGYDLYCYDCSGRASRGVVPSSRAKNQGSPYRTSAKTQEEVREEKIREELSRFEKYVGPLNQDLYNQEVQQVLKNLKGLFHG